MFCVLGNYATARQLSDPGSKFYCLQTLIAIFQVLAHIKATTDLSSGSSSARVGSREPSPQLCSLSTRSCPAVPLASASTSVCTNRAERHDQPLQLFPRGAGQETQHCEIIVAIGGCQTAG